MRPRWRELGATVAWVVGLAASVVLLLRMGRGPLAAPPLTDLDAVRTWLAGRSSVVAACAVLRLVALATAAYLALLTVLALAARVTSSPLLTRIATIGTLPVARRLLGGVAGLGLGASAVTLAFGSTATRAPTAAVVEHPTGGLVLERQPSRSDVVLERIDTDDHGPHGTATMHVVLPDAPAAPAPAPPASDVWVAQPGDSMWSAAASHLEETWGRPVTDAEVTPYWQTLVDANRTRLADPKNPDLIFTGQSFVLPPVPPRP